MSKLGCLLGIVLIVVGFAALFFFSVVPPEVRAGNASIAGLQNALFCNPNEQYVEVLGGYVTNSFGRNAGRSFSAFCEDAEGQQRDVTGRTFAIMGGAFAVPFLLGLLLAVGALVAMVNRGSKRAGAVPASGFQPGERFTHASVITVNGQQVDSLPPEAAEVLQQVMSGFQATASQLASQQNDLPGKLRQLQEARDAGLITEDEYNRVRQQILDKMDD
jgi:hypothetical protein